MTAQDLFDYARRYAEKHERAGRGTVYPTMRQATKKFHVTLDDIEAIVGDDCGGYLGIACAVGISGVGYADLGARGNYLIEAYQ